MQVEKTGEWPKALNLVLIVLLAKADGGVRPIGLFPTIIRIWMRARTAQARPWEAGNHSNDLYGGEVWEPNERRGLRLSTRKRLY